MPAHDGLGDAHGVRLQEPPHQEASRSARPAARATNRRRVRACHQGVVKPMDFHPGNYVLTHAVDGRRGKPDCSACHRAQSFCVGCHGALRLGTAGDTRSARSTRSARFIRRAGPAGPRRNRQPRGAPQHHQLRVVPREDECLTCHSARPARSTPRHPTGWRGSARCKALDRGQPPVCLRCHITQAQLGCDLERALAATSSRVATSGTR